MNDEIDQIIRTEAKRFVDKDRSKLKLTLGLYALTLKGRELGKVARASYFFVRHLDDLLDGELDVGADPVEYATDLKEQVKTGAFNAKWPISKLAAYSLPVLESKAKYGDDPRDEFVRVIDAMLFDHYRRHDRRVLNNSELRYYYQESLDPGLNLLLIGLGSNLRAKDIPDFSPCLGRLYSLRDMQKDWQLGIINIPDNILREGMLSQHATYQQVASSSFISEWAEREIVESIAGLYPTHYYLENLDEPLTQKIVGGLVDNAIKHVA